MVASARCCSTPPRSTATDRASLISGLRVLLAAADVKEPMEDDTDL